MATLGSLTALSTPNKLFNLDEASKAVLANNKLQNGVAAAAAIRALEPDFAAGGERAASAYNRLMAIAPTSVSNVDTTGSLMTSRQPRYADGEQAMATRLATTLNGLPEDQRATAYGRMVAQAQTQGVLLQAPAEYPGHEHIQALAGSGLPAQQLFSVPLRQRSRQDAQSLFGDTAF